MGITYKVHVFVDGGTREDVSNHIPHFFRYLIDTITKAKENGSCVVDVNTYIQDIPADMTFVMLGPDACVLEYAARNGFPVATEIHHVNIIE